MRKFHLLLAGISGFTAVTLGAFGAHGLKDILSPGLMDTYKTGILYHLIHSVVLLTLALSDKNFIKSYWFIFIGIILFSFSLYAYAVSGIKFLAMITPLGGVCFLIGWALIIYSAVKTKSD